MSTLRDGPASPHFRPLALAGGTPLSALTAAGVPAAMAEAAGHAPAGPCVAWGIPFELGDPIVLAGSPVTVPVAPTRAAWLVFMHAADLRQPAAGPGGFISPMRGEGVLGEHAADYVLCYAGGAEARAAIRRRHHVGAFRCRWGENCFQAVPQHKPRPTRADHEQPAGSNWGKSQTRVDPMEPDDWCYWLWAWENPRPEAEIVALRFEPAAGAVLVAAVSAGDASEQPLRWRTRRKAVLTLPPDEPFLPELDAEGLLGQVQLDLGQVIHAAPRLRYPVEDWAEGYHNQLPVVCPRELLVEYTSHPDACFHLAGGQVIPAAEAEAGSATDVLQPVPPARRRVRIRALLAGSGAAVPVKLHVHGASGEYLAPVDRHRIPNGAWFEDYAPDATHLWTHPAAYIPGETVIDLPLGRVYLEVSKGFEIRPVRLSAEVTPETEEIVVELEKVLPWREAGWVTADTHVHFLSPMTARLEGAAEGVNVVNLLASQWGELMTNAGDFDGATTWGSREAGGDGEHLVRVGTENRQHVLGHISLLGYRGPIIAPMTVGGPDEAALGDPVDVLLSEWARQCKRQGGLVVLPHFPDPRAEHAAAIVNGDIDAVEMTSWEDPYLGIDPYSLADWYRYLNCGYLTAAVGGTDKMTAATAVGTVRTYARLAAGAPFDYEAWLDAVRRAETFVTYGPLLDFAVNGRPMGSRIALPRGGGALDVVWRAASVTVPMTRVELIVNGAIRESRTVAAWEAAGSWTVRVEASAWLALLVRGAQPGRPEIIAAHSSPVLAEVEGSRLLAAADAVTILDQIEGALAYLDTVGTRAEDAAYKRMRLVLQGAHRSLHNRMHAMGTYHDHDH